MVLLGVEDDFEGMLVFGITTTGLTPEIKISDRFQTSLNGADGTSTSYSPHHSDSTKDLDAQSRASRGNSRRLAYQVDLAF